MRGTPEYPNGRGPSPWAGNAMVTRQASYYGQAGEGEGVMMVNSAGHLEIAMHGARSADKVGAHAAMRSRSARPFDACCWVTVTRRR